MPYIAGIAIAVGTCLLAYLARLDRDRAFYPTVLIVVASYYVLFATMAGSLRLVGVELIAMTLFTVAAVTGFRWNLWLVAIALAGHGVFDLFHGSIIQNPGVPIWWPAFCLAFDVVAAVCMVIAMRRPQPAQSMHSD